MLRLFRDASVKVMVVCPVENDCADSIVPWHSSRNVKLTRRVMVLVMINVEMGLFFRFLFPSEIKLLEEQVFDGRHFAVGHYQPGRQIQKTIPLLRR